MTSAQQKMAYGCIERINHIWFEPNAVERPVETVFALFEVLSRVAPYKCCHHVHYLWLAYRRAKEEHCYRLAKYRLELFCAGLKHLKELADRLPESARHLN